MTPDRRAFAESARRLLASLQAETKRPLRRPLEEIEAEGKAIRDSVLQVFGEDPRPVSGRKPL